MKNDFTFTNAVSFFRATILSLLFLTSFHVQSQEAKRNSVWYFGEQAGLDFKSNRFPPAFLNDGKINTDPNSLCIEGTTTICDTAGNLLMYTDGVNIWDSSHQKMPNTNGTNDTTEWDRMLSGAWSAATNSIFAPVIEDPHRFYVLTTDGATEGSCNNGKTRGPNYSLDGLYYTIVDLRLNNGKGDIDTAWVRAKGYEGNKIPLIDATMEKIGIALHPNKRDYWVIARRQYVDNAFYAYSVTCAGLNETPVISPMFENNANAAGEIHSNKDGTKLFETNGINLVSYDFDNLNGKVSSKQILGSSDDPVEQYYGCAVSANDSFLYATRVKRDGEWLGVATYGSFVEAFDITTNPPTFIKSFGPFDDSSVLFPAVRDIELAIDGNIYYNSAFSDNSISCLKNSGDINKAFFEIKKVPLGPGKSGFTVPKFFPYERFNRNWIPTIELERNLTLCPDDSITLGPRDTLVGLDYWWTPGNNLKDSTILNPVVQPSSNEMYTLHVKDNCSEEYTYDIQVELIDDTIVFTDGGIDSLFCGVDSIRLEDTLTYPVNYVWPDSSTNSYFYATEGGIYAVKRTADCWMDTLYKEVVEEQCPCNIFIPNAFTPNGDGENNQFSPIIDCPTIEYQLKVYDRFGKLVFKANRMQDRWDGTYKENLLNAGVYVYQFTARLTDQSEEIRKTGNVTLIR